MTHEDYMRQALALAGRPPPPGEVPVGCVIVDRAGQIIGRGRNRREEDKSPLAHAELAAITDACRSHGDWRLKGARLYVTLEPCPMCAGGIPLRPDSRALLRGQRRRLRSLRVYPQPL